MSSVTIVAVYFFLNSEDHRWPWLSFMASASTAIYVYIYAFFYFLVKTEYVQGLNGAFLSVGRICMCSVDELRAPVTAKWRDVLVDCRLLQHVGTTANEFLLRVHGCVLRCHRRHVRHDWFLLVKPVREPYLPQHQGGLATRVCSFVRGMQIDVFLLHPTCYLASS